MNDTNPQTCPQCGKPLPADAPGGLCPSCVMAMNLSPETWMSTAGSAEAKAPTPTPEEMAERFPNFEITECLGRGGMGVVYKARQKKLDREVAIKVLAGEWRDDPKFAKRFEREAKTLAQMSHPSIVTVHDFGEVDGLYYIVMEYIDGVNLRDLLSDGKMEPEQALAIVPPICEALEYAHGKRVVHRDIKPENLLLDRDGRVKIADFGIASLVGNTTEASGTPSYMAPEQTNGKVDRRADIYSLGVVLYEMLTGERPEKDVVPPSKRVQVDVKIDEMVLRALEMEPERRYQTAHEFQTTAEFVRSTQFGAAKEQVSPIASPTAQNTWKSPDSGWGWFIGKLFGITFTSPTAYKVANLSALGFLGFLGFAGNVPLSAAKVLFGLHGLFGLFGLIGVASMIEMSQRKNGAPSGDAGRTIPLNWQFGLVIGTTVAAAVLGALVARDYLAQPGLTAPAGIHFSPKREVVLLEVEAKGEGPRFLDLDSGYTRPMPEREHKSEAGLLAWMTEEGLDLCADRIGKEWGLATRKLRLVRISPEQLAGISPGDLPAILAQPDLGLKVDDDADEGGWTGYFLPEPLPESLALAFRTAEGAVGVMRINAMIDEPARLMIRYKLVQQDSEGGPVEAEQAPAEAQAEAFQGRWLWEEGGTGDKVWLTLPAAGPASLQGSDFGSQLHFHRQSEWRVRKGKLEVTLGADRATGELTNDRESLRMETSKDERKVLFQKTDETPPAISTDLVLIEDLALHMIVAIREKDNQELKSLATDQIKDWREALPVFAVELRERYRQIVGDEEFDLRVTESLVKDDLGLVRCTGPGALKGKCLILSFMKTPDGWKNCLLRNSTEQVELGEHLSELEHQHAADK